MVEIFRGLPPCADEVASSHLTLPEKPRALHLYNIGAVISMKSKYDPKYALKSFLALKMRECCNVVEDDEGTYRKSHTLEHRNIM